MTRTFFYFAILIGLFLAVGTFLGGSRGAFYALLIALTINFLSYWFSSKIVLALYRAKEMKEVEYPFVYRIIKELSLKDSLPLPRIYLIPIPQANAFATGRDENHAVVGITVGILQLLSEDELRGVLAHELSHIKNKDMLIGTMAATLAGALSWLGHFFAFGNNNESKGNLLVSLVLFIVTPLIAFLIQLAISRTREYQADASGARLLGEGKNLASALQKLQQATKTFPLQGSPAENSTSHLFIVNPFKPSFFMNLFSTHPPIEERIKRLQNL